MSRPSRDAGAVPVRDAVRPDEEVGRGLRHWAATHAGRVRPTNQDAHLCRPDIGLFAVADGVGGSADGAVASAALARGLDRLPGDLPPPARLAAARDCIERTHAELLAGAPAAGSTAGPASTVVVALLHGAHLACLWAGDSRAYLVRHGRLHQLTVDHSLVHDLVRSGTLTEAEADRHPRGNVITRAIGVGRDGALVDKAVCRVEAGDRLLLCTDGLTKALPPEALIKGVAAADPAAALIGSALERGARDNVTAVVVEVESGSFL